jgi:hypothetical protein
MTPAQLSEHRFAVFVSPKWGFRALATVLLNYSHLHGLNTVRGIISRWAPSSENNTAAYVEDVARDLGVGADATLEMHNPIVLEKLAKAISTHECGGWHFAEADLEAGVALALKDGE